MKSVDIIKFKIRWASAINITRLQKVKYKTTLCLSYILKELVESNFVFIS